MKKHNNLVWIVVCMSLILGLVVMGDNQVYGAYKKESAQTPAPAYAIRKIADEFGHKEKTEVPAAKTPVRTVEEIASQIKLADNNVTNGIGPGEPADEQIAQPAQETDPMNDPLQPAAPEAVQEEKTAQPSPASQPAFVTADMSYFDDACFIGDSFTQGLSIYSKNPNADYYYYVGVGTKNLDKVDFTLPGGNKGNLWDALGQKQYGKIYILLGINELGSDPPEVFAQRYAEVIKKVQALQPGATIFIQSILHTTQQKSSTTNFKNETINKNNEALKMLADGNKVFYIDINPLFDDETGALRSDISGDGVHIKANCYIEWRDYLLRNVPANLVPEAQMSMEV